jgi:hypothetical protein
MSSMAPIAPSANSAFGNFRPDLAAGMKPFDQVMLEEGLIGLKIAPAIEVSETYANIGKYLLGDLLRQYATARAEGASYNQVTFGLADFTYQTRDNGIVVPLDDRRVNALRNRFADLEIYAAELARQISLTALEDRIYDAVLDATVMTGGLTDAVGTAWSATDTATPISDLTEFSYQVWNNCGWKPDSLALNYRDYLYLRENESVLARISANGAGDKIKPVDVTEAMLAQALDLKQILVSKRQVNTAATGAAMALQPLWPTGSGLLFKAMPAGGDPFAPGFAGTYHWGEDGSVIGGVIETDGDWDKRSKKVRSRMDTDEKIRYAEMGLRITGLSS